MKSGIRTTLWLIKDFSPLSIVRVLSYYLKKKTNTLSGEDYLVCFKYKGRKIKVKLKENDDDFAILRGIFYNECYETDRKAEIIFDCGAHLGFASIYYSILNPNAKIYCFEPDKNTLPLLRFNLALNNINATVLDIAISNKDTILNFDENKDKSSNSMIKENGKSKVIARRLDSICKLFNVDKIDLLKLDIEGQEVNALNSLGKVKVNEVICENDFRIGKNSLKKAIEKKFKIKTPNPNWLRVYGNEDCLIAGVKE